MRVFSILTPVAVLLTCAPFPGQAQERAMTALERVLAMAADHPGLAGANVFVNLAVQGAGVANGSDIVGSSVQFVHQGNEDDLPPTPLEMQVSTMATGATNTGRVRVMTSATPLPEGVGAVIIAANAATTQSHILAPIDIVSTAPLSDDSRLATKAIGAMNTGGVTILIKPGANE